MQFADDLCIVSLSSAGLQSLLSIGNKYCTSHFIKYLDFLVNSSMKTSIHVFRQTRIFYAQIIILLHQFCYCGRKVKCMLFKLFLTFLCIWIVV